MQISLSAATSIAHHEFFEFTSTFVNLVRETRTNTTSQLFYITAESHRESAGVLVSWRQCWNESICQLARAILAFIWAINLETTPPTMFHYPLWLPKTSYNRKKPGQTWDRKPVNQEHQLLRVRYPCNNNYYNVVGRHVRTCILELLVQNYWYT